jgi:transmembrane sensor
VTASDEEIRGAIAEQAGKWFIAQQTESLTEEESASFLAWLKTSPLHVREYLGIARIARQLPTALGPPRVPLETFLAQLGDECVVSIEGSRRTSPASRRRGVWALPLAAGLASLAIGAFWWAHDWGRFGFPKTYRTAHGEQSVQRLADGSVLRLDTDSQATVRYSKGERLVELNHGQALFEVTHEPRRRFRVSAGPAGAIAVGTRFDVYRKGEITEITVAEGEVAVFPGTPPWLHGHGSVPAEVQRVTAGYLVRIDGAAQPAQPVPADLNQQLGWVQHKIVFQHRPLGEVAAEFNRYGRIPVEIEDEELRALPVSGVFDATDTDSFVTFLKTLPGVKVERTRERIRVTR